MWAGLIKGALKQRILVALGAVALAIWGANAYRQLSIDAFPDVAPTQVLVSMRAPGLTPEELESRITQPIELAVRGIPNLVKMRSTTRYSVALLTFDFADGTDIFWARAQVNERLLDVRDQLPAGADGGTGADRDAAGRNGDVHNRIRGADPAGEALFGGLDHPSGLARPSWRRGRQCAGRLRADLRGRSVGSSHGRARNYDRTAGKRDPVQ
jgi:hypothetical protein